jgi:hypothetical protein
VLKTTWHLSDQAEAAARYDSLRRGEHLDHGPGRPGAVKRPQRFPMEIHFVWRFCVGAQPPKTAVSGPSCRRLFGPLSSYYCKMLLVPVLPY